MTSTANLPVDIETIRAAFPSLAAGPVFLENAGGSQVPYVVARRIYDYMLESYVQLGAGYALSQTCTQVVDDAHAFVGRLMNARDGTVILGPSTTTLIHLLSECYAARCVPGWEIVLAQSGHEANLGPWTRLADHGARLRWWTVDCDSTESTLAALDEVLSEHTRIVAFPHVSNLLGGIIDVAAVTKRVHEAGARVVVDGVAFAPHRAIDVAAWNVDWYVYSTYKVYGPHMAALYGRSDAVAELEGPNHFFIPREEVPYKFELGGASHEGCAGILALGTYLNMLAGKQHDAVCERSTIEAAFEIMQACEVPVQQRLMDYLVSKPGVRVIGPRAADGSRVSTISFVHDKLSAREITSAVDGSGIAIRHGHMYAYRLCEALGLDPEDGVVRVSAVHYNTVDEIERLTEVLDSVL